ncbi:MAG TPA: nucleotidyltransferase family protein [Pyrinomonadaceae bacterium]|nr:nucleotidyltransferase family protein [Pyrinomonadaceae bacterium]
MEDIAAIILAAGRSERMGAFKPLLNFGAHTVIKACVEYLRGGGVETVVVVLGQGPRADDLHHHLKDSSVTFATNPDQTSQMSDSIACGLQAIPPSAKAVLITPADHPAVPADVVRVLIEEWRNGARLVMPTNAGRGGHPVLVDLQLIDELRHLGTSGGLKGLFDSHRDEVRRVAVGSGYIARDMDTWDDYRALHQEVFGVPPPEIPTQTVNNKGPDDAN